MLKLADRESGYHRAKASDSVIDVMEGINTKKGGKLDVALVFDDVDETKLLGIFTDADYIRVSIMKMLYK